MLYKPFCSTMCTNIENESLIRAKAKKIGLRLRRARSRGPQRAPQRAGNAHPNAHTNAWKNRQYKCRVIELLILVFEFSDCLITLMCFSLAPLIFDPLYYQNQILLNTSFAILIQGLNFLRT